MTCPRCDAPVSPEHLYCEQCGVNLRWARAGCVACGSPDIGEDGFCLQCGRAQPSDRDRIELIANGLAGGVSDRGKRRRRNEDAMACAHTGRDGGIAVVAVVCDGVASVQRGDEAAQVAVQSASAALLSAVTSDTADLGEATRVAARRAAQAVSALAAHDASSPRTVDQVDAAAPSSTYVSAVVTDEQVVIGWIGDSRAYWLGERSRRLTTDHTVGGVLTSWLGADAGEVDPQVRVFQPDGSGVVLLCSDGLWNYLPEPDQLAAVALPLLIGDGVNADPFAAASALTERALAAGGQDNITVIVLPFPPSPSPTADGTEQM